MIALVTSFAGKIHRRRKGKNKLPPATGLVPHQGGLGNAFLERVDTRRVNRFGKVSYKGYKIQVDLPAKPKKGDYRPSEEIPVYFCLAPVILYDLQCESSSSSKIYPPLAVLNLIVTVR